MRIKTFKMFENVLAASVKGGADISIVEDHQDDDNYRVYYGVGDNIEITGMLYKFNTGRAYEYQFEPSMLTKIEQEYFDNNWENIEQEIKDYFYSKFNFRPFINF